MRHVDEGIGDVEGVTQPVSHRTRTVDEDVRWMSSFFQGENPSFTYETGKAFFEKILRMSREDKDVVISRLQEWEARGFTATREFLLQPRPLFRWRPPLLSIAHALF